MVIAIVFSDSSPAFTCIPVYTLEFDEVNTFRSASVHFLAAGSGTDTNAEARGPQLPVKSLRILEPEATIEKGIGPVIDVSIGWLYCE